jgi:hypothetical protein
MVYLASPYTCRSRRPWLNRRIQHLRARLASIACGLLINDGLVVFGPITFSHPIERELKLPGSWEYWEAFDRWYVERAVALWLLKLPGWERSVGMQAEIKIAQEHMIEVCTFRLDILQKVPRAKKMLKELEFWERTER